MKTYFDDKAVDLTIWKRILIIAVFAFIALC